MKFKKSILVGVTAFSFGGLIAFNSSHTVSASNYFPVRHYHTYTPRSWRGSYYTAYGDTMKVKTYSVELNGKTIYKNSWAGWRKLAFAKVGIRNYTFNALAKYGYQSSRRWHLKYKNGKKELINLQVMGYITVWHKYYPAKKYKFRTADNTDFFYNTWRPAYLDMDSDGTDIYNSYKDAKSEENPVNTLSDSRKQLYAKWISKNQHDNVLMLKIDGNIYYENNDDHDIFPYNAYRSEGSIWSNFKPTSKYALLKKGNHVYKGTEWTYFYDDDGNNKTYEYTGSRWQFEY